MKEQEQGERKRRKATPQDDPYSYARIIRFPLLCFALYIKHYTHIISSLLLLLLLLFAFSSISRPIRRLHSRLGPLVILQLLPVLDPHAIVAPIPTAGRRRGLLGLRAEGQRGVCVDGWFGDLLGRACFC